MLRAMSAENWDALAGFFGGPPGPEEIPATTADNILLAWPPMIECLRRGTGSLQNRTVLDFGCGAGHFTRKLGLLGARVVGVDPSPAMIEHARTRANDRVEFRCGNLEAVRPDEQFEAMTAMMVFPFIEDLPALLRGLDPHLAPGGTLALGAFNPGFVRTLLRAGHFFRDFDSRETPRRGLLDLTGRNPVPVFVRYAEEYAYAMEDAGYALTFEARPPFTPDFLARYPQPFPTHVPEYLIMGFRKNLHTA